MLRYSDKRQQKRFEAMLEAAHWHLFGQTQSWGITLKQFAETSTGLRNGERKAIMTFLGLSSAASLVIYPGGSSMEKYRLVKPYMDNPPRTFVVNRKTLMLVSDDGLGFITPVGRKEIPALFDAILEGALEWAVCPYDAFFHPEDFTQGTL